MTPLSTAQRLYVRRKVRAATANTGGTAANDDELNIVPFLDIVVNLVMFLLMVTTASLAAGQLPVDQPAHRPGVVPDGPLQLTVLITHNETRVASDRGGVAAACSDLQSVAGAPDALGLRRCAQAMFERHPDARVVLTADPTVRHGHLVRAMDALRGTAMQPLYSTIRFAGGVR